MRLEYGEAKGCRWTPCGHAVTEAEYQIRFKGRRAGLVDTRLGQLDMGLEHGGGEREGVARAKRCNRRAFRWIYTFSFGLDARRRVACCGVGVLIL